MPDFLKTDLGASIELIVLVVLIIFVGWLGDRLAKKKGWW